MFQRFLVLTLIAGVLAACGAPAASINAPAQIREVTMAMPYIPNVQFAYFYLADKKGFYTEEGLKVNFDYNFETDVVQRVAQNTLEFGASSGDSVLLARAQGLPVVTVATSNQRFPVVFYSKPEVPINEPADLKGKTVGIPGRFGASYIGLLALLYATNMQESDLNVQEVGFAQLAALTEDKIQVASGYGNNEPIQLQQQGINVNVLRVSDYFPLASDGLITSEKLIKEQPDLVRGFVRATLRGMQATIDNPDEAFTIALEYIPEAQRGDQELQRKVLQETIKFWESELTGTNGLGFSNIENWKATHTFLRDSGLLKSDVDLEQAVTNEFIK
jgi:NitT/TauT family transport system substrate-binding protein